jgi:hypothetical protein
MYIETYASYRAQQVKAQPRGIKGSSTILRRSFCHLDSS